MADRPFDAAAYVDAAAALNGLPIDPVHRPGVVVNIERLAQMAALVMDFPLPEEAEPAAGVPAVSSDFADAMWRRSPRRCAVARLPPSR